MTDPVADAIDTEIAAVIALPKSVTVDGESTTMQSIPDLIAAAKYRGAQNAVNGTTGGMVHRRLKPPGASGVHS